eukprot:gene13825-29406_t
MSRRRRTDDDENHSSNEEDEDWSTEGDEEDETESETGNAYVDSTSIMEILPDENTGIHRQIQIVEDISTTNNFQGDDHITNRTLDFPDSKRDNRLVKDTKKQSSNDNRIEITKPEDPASVPKAGKFFLHDDRNDRQRRPRRISQTPNSRPKGPPLKEESMWKHDKFIEIQQQLELEDPSPSKRRGRERQNRENKKSEVRGVRGHIGGLDKKNSDSGQIQDSGGGAVEVDGTKGLKREGTLSLEHEPSSQSRLQGLTSTMTTGRGRGNRREREREINTVGSLADRRRDRQETSRFAERRTSQDVRQQALRRGRDGAANGLGVMMTNNSPSNNNNNNSTNDRHWSDGGKRGSISAHPDIQQSQPDPVSSDNNYQHGDTSHDQNYESSDNTYPRRQSQMMSYTSTTHTQSQSQSNDPKLKASAPEFRPVPHASYPQTQSHSGVAGSSSISSSMPSNLGYGAGAFPHGMQYVTMPSSSSTTPMTMSTGSTMSGDVQQGGNVGSETMSMTMSMSYPTASAPPGFAYMPPSMSPMMYMTGGMPAAMPDPRNGGMITVSQQAGTSWYQGNSGHGVYLSTTGGDYSAAMSGYYTQQPPGFAPQSQSLTNLDANAKTFNPSIASTNTYDYQWTPT